MPAPKRIFFDEHVDTLIRRAYANHGKPGNMQRLSERLGISTTSICRRAVAIGCHVRTNKVVRKWTQQEIDILEANAHKELETINRALIRQGFASRSIDSIKYMLRRQGFDQRESKVLAGLYSQKQLALLMGVYPSTISNYIRSGILEANRRPGVDQIEYNIKVKHVKRLIIDYAPQIDISKCDKYWLIDILTGKFDR